MTSRSFKNKGGRKRPSPKRVELRRGQRNGNCTARDVVEAVPASELRALYRFWGGVEGGSVPRDEDSLRARVVDCMSEPSIVAERIDALEPWQATIVKQLSLAPSYERALPDLAERHQIACSGAADVEDSLALLRSHGWLVETGDGSQRAFALPAEIGDGLRLRSEPVEAGERTTFQVLTLRGFLDWLYAQPERAGRTTPNRLREMYKMYAVESGAVARIDRLPDGVRTLVEKAILEFGGILPRGLFERMTTDLPHWNGRRWKMILEKSLVGTVERLNLESCGIRHDDETLVVFNEVALAWLRRVAVPGDPDRPHTELSRGIELVSNLSHFLAFIQDNDVRFTVRGDIFKTTERKILQHLIPNPGRELSREEVLAFIYRFARSSELIDSTGERTIGLTKAGREWGLCNLHDKLSTLLDYAVDETEDEELGSEPFHQVRLRRIFLRLVKRVEVDVWYDAMYLPFLARNTYFASLGDLEVESHFADRVHAGGYSPQEDPQRLAWSLMRWVRKRLYLMGLVDLGYDKSDRPVAIRVTAIGARLFGMPLAPADSSGVGTIVVTPDFEVVLFPTGDDAELVHNLDRFCERDKQGHLLHYRLTEASVRRALSEGLYLERILETLDSHSRTPVPQNVRFSIRDWALSAGLMTLGSDLVLRCEDPGTWTRLRQDPGARPYVSTFLEDGTARLKGRSSPKRLQSVFRELGYLVEVV